jgi:hypothetical protein
MLVYSEKNANGTKEYHSEVTDRHLMDSADDRAPGFPVSFHCCIPLLFSVVYHQWRT